MIYKFCRFICWLIFKIVLRLEVSGKENIPKEEAVMLVANHVSFLDPVALGTAVKRQLVYFTRADLFNIPLFGRLLHKLNTVPVNRKKFEFSLLRKISELVKNNQTFVIFPEGRRSRTGKLQPGKAGVGLIAWKTRVKVIPALIRGTDRALPARAKFIRPVKVKVSFGKALDLSSFYQQKPKKELFQEIVERIMRSIKELQI